MFIDDCLLQFFDSANCRVLRKVGLNGTYACLLDVFRSREIGFTGAKVYDVNSLLAEFDGSFHDRHCLRNGNARNSRCQVHVITSLS